MKLMHSRFALLLLCVVSISAQAQTSSFTYQGQLIHNGAPANGSYDLVFTLVGAPGGGPAVAPPLTNSATAVTNGLFTVTLDFGAGAFPGADRWLELGVRTNNTWAFTTLLPRQPLSPTPYAIQAANAGVAASVNGLVSAAQLSGTIQARNIGESSITSVMLAPESVHSNHLALGSVTAAALADGSIHSNHLAVGSVHSNALALASVTAFALADDSIHSNHLAVGSVHSNALALASVTTGALADGSVHSNTLALGSVTAFALADDSIHSNHLAVGSVHSNALALGSVTALALADGSIHSNHLAVGSVHSNALALASVTAFALADDSIHSNHLAVGSVHSNALALGSVTALALADGSVHSNALVLGSVTAFALADDSIHSNHLAVGSVHSNALALGSVTALALADGSIHSNHLAVGSVHSNALALASVTAFALADDSIHSNHLAVGSVHSNALALGSVTALALADGTIHSNHLAAGSVDSGALVIGSIHSNHLAASAVSPDKLTASWSSQLSTSISNPSIGSLEHFGAAVAGVGTDKLLVGAPQDSTGGDNVGAAYLLTTAGTVLTTFLKPGGQIQDRFGSAVAAVGPDKVLIGADGDDTGAADAGAAFLFSTNGALIATFTNPTPAAADFFGFSVAAVGVDKVLIGAHGDHSGANVGGAAYLYNTSGALLTVFTNPTPASGDRFGIAVAAVGLNMVVIGADRDDTAAADAGIAYLFNTDGALLATIANPTPAPGDAFGAALAGVAGDKVLIGAPGDNSNGNAGGAAYLFNTSGALLATVTNPAAASGDQFGIAVAAVGANTMTIGAPAGDSGGTKPGSAYLYNASGALLSTFHSSPLSNGDLFGSALAGVGTDKILVGAPQADAGAEDSGAVYLFTLESYTPGLVADAVRAGSVTTTRLQDGAVTLDKLDSSIGIWTRAANNVYRASGRVGIGTSTPQTTLHVQGVNSHLRLHDSARGNFWHIFTENHPNALISGNLVFAPGPAGTYGFIQKSSGNYFSSSDARLKRDINGLRGVLDRVLRLRPVTYRFKSASDAAPPTIGLIAQDVEPLFPEVVGEHDGMKCLSYSELVPVTVGAIQELNQKLEKRADRLEQELKRRDVENEELKARLQRLETLLSQRLTRGEN